MTSPALPRIRFLEIIIGFLSWAVPSNLVFLLLFLRMHAYPALLDGGNIVTILWAVDLLIFLVLLLIRLLFINRSWMLIGFFAALALNFLSWIIIAPITIFTIIIWGCIPLPLGLVVLAY